MASDYEAITAFNEVQLGCDNTTRITQISMYSDPTHFVFEILQNADDYRATYVDFILTNDSITIEHNGVPFREENVKAITYFGRSTSEADQMKTGRFGVGFKAVFAFTATPFIFSGAEHFKIFELYRICECPYPQEFRQDRTRIVLPFNLETEKPDFVTNYITPQDAYLKLDRRLSKLNMKSLLFTKNIKEIRWKTETRDGHYLREDSMSTDSHCRWTTITDGKDVEEYLVYSQEFVWSGEKNKDVEIAFAIGEKKALVPMNAPLYVLFATKQNPGYQFIINGPFNTTPNRETILDDDPLNIALIDVAAEMFNRIMPDLRDRSLIDRASLAVFPNEQDPVDKSFAQIRNSIIDMFNEQPLVPAQSGGFAPAKHLLQGHSELKDLLNTDERLEFFIDGKSRRWAINCFQNKRSDLLLESLCIEKWDWREFSTALRMRFFPNIKKSSEAWLASQPDEWLGLLYSSLWQNICDNNWYKWFEKNRLDDLRIIRLKNGNHVKGCEAYFPAEIRHCELLEIPMVKEQVLQVGNDKQQKRIWSYLTEIGVSAYDEKAEIKIILNEWYAKDTPCPTTDQHMKHMRQFIQLFKNIPDSVELFKGRHIFLDNTDTYAPADHFILDHPFEQTGLVALVNQGISDYSEYRQLYLGYQDLVDSGFVTFAKKAGVHSMIPIVECPVYENPDAPELMQVLYTKNTRESPNVTNEDFTIRNIDAICARKNHEVAKCLWLTMCKAKPEVMFAKYSPNNKFPVPTTAPSQLVHVLRDKAWVPSQSGEFFKPCDLSLEDLSDGFIYDDSNGWLTAVYFAKNCLSISDAEQEMARKYHFDMDYFRELEGLPDEDRAEIQRRNLQAIREYKAKRANNNYTLSDSGVSEPVRRPAKEADPIASDSDSDTSHSLVISEYKDQLAGALLKHGGNIVSKDQLASGSTVPNPERRREKENEALNDDIIEEPKPNERFQTLPRKVWDKKDSDIRVFLEKEYGGQCQICSFGFSKRSGAPYFVAHFLVPQSLAKWSDRAGNVLCLCANCAAKLQHGSVSVERLEEQILGARLNKEGGDGGLSVKIMLCEQPENITFSERHILALQELLKRSISEITSNETPSAPIVPQSEPKSTQSKTVKNPEMTTCPECGDKIKKTRLERHLQKVHRKRLGKKPATGRTRILRNGKWELQP